MKALKASLKPQATVCRDGRWQTIDCAVLVPGDLVLLGSGSHIPADCRVCVHPQSWTVHLIHLENLDGPTSLRSIALTGIFWHAAEDTHAAGHHDGLHTAVHSVLCTLQCSSHDS